MRQERYGDLEQESKKPEAACMPLVANKALAFCFSISFYLRNLFRSQKMSAMTRTIRIMAVHIPALKMPPTTSQEVKVVATINAAIMIDANRFIVSYFGLSLANVLP
jgi:hypothetical protein